jgi:hypothetical protein
MLRFGGKLAGRFSLKSAQLKVQPKRNLGGHHDAHAKSSGPYSVPHHDAYPNEAYAFGIKPGESSEGWEVITYGVYALCAAILVVGMSFKNDDFKVRANCVPFTIY